MPASDPAGFTVLLGNVGEPAGGIVALVVLANFGASGRLSFFFPQANKLGLLLQPHMDSPKMATTAIRPNVARMARSPLHFVGQGAAPAVSDVLVACPLRRHPLP
jgi:hypothetical protein